MKIEDVTARTSQASLTLMKVNAWIDALGKYSVDENGVEWNKLTLAEKEKTAKKALSQAASDLRVLPSLREQIEMERNKINAAQAAAEDKLQRDAALEIGAEIGHGTLERTVEITIGTDIDALMGAEILTEDGKIIAFRE